MRYRTVAVVGLGHVGLPTAALLAERHIRVLGVDVDPGIVATINGGAVHIVEPGLEAVVRSAVREGRLRATSVLEPAEAFLIAVPTPLGDGRRPDLGHVRAAGEAIARVLKKGDLIILESTSPVGTTEALAGWLHRARPDLTFPHTHGESSDIRIAYCPERVLPGRALQELVWNDRVIGGMTPECAEAAVALYKTFVDGACIVTDTRTAELCKLAENSFRDVNIALANELSVICDRLGVDVSTLIGLANRHPRVDILRPGPGVGGHCIAIDPWFIVASAPEEARLIHTARMVNDGKPRWVAGKVRQAVGEFLLANPERTARDVRLACLGLAYKPDIADLRESPAMAVAEDLAGSFGDRLLLVEPNIERLPSSLARHAKVDLGSALERADILVLLVAHTSFEGIEEKIGPGQVFFSVAGG